MANKAMAPKERKTEKRTAQIGILARYGNFYHGDDDEFAHCFILENGRCVLLFQGLQDVTMEFFDAPDDKFDQLKGLLSQPIPAGWPAASYSGYDFVTNAEGPNGNEIAAYGVQQGDTRPPGQYYAVPAADPVAALVKAIAQVD